MWRRKPRTFCCFHIEAGEGVMIPVPIRSIGIPPSPHMETILAYP